MAFEHFSQPLLPYHQWLRRILRSIGLAGLLVGSALGIGVMGYHLIGGLPWIDALLEASMILGGMGAVAPMTTNAIKLFAAAYALFSGIVFVTTMGVVVAPWLHRMLHKLHEQK